ncbi:MAG: protein kinase [Deltaproteobacteria bacterium]|nr:protein kinase [Deltaproteobacteria bacterium]
MDEGETPARVAIEEDAPFRDVFSIGDVLSSCYEIKRLLGAGGMGQVYEAHDRALNRKVAIKAHWRHMRAYSLRKEAQALAAIRHPAVATVHGLGEHDGAEFVVMERIWGVSLAEHLGHARRAKMSIPLAEAIQLLSALSDGLSAVHAAGIAHRDVKPANIMLAPRGRVVLMDFGIMLPEYAVMHAAPSVSPGAAHLLDVYAFGVVAFEVLSGKLPFSGGPLGSVLMQHLRDTPATLEALRTNVPPSVSSLIASCLSKDPSDRPQTMEQISAALRRAPRVHDPRTTTPSSRFSVLVVDDDPSCAELVAEVVRDAAPNAMIHVVHDGETALSHLRRGAPDLMVLDVGLPGMNGLELCMYLRGAGIAERMQIVSISAAAQSSDVSILRQLGVRAFFRKGQGLVEGLDRIVREICALR